MTTDLQYINGQRRAGSSEETLRIINPSTGEELASGTAADATDVETAVAAARKAFEDWSRRTPAERAEIIQRWSDLVAEQHDELVELEADNCGKSWKLANGFDVPGVVDNTSFFAAAARNLDGKASAEYSGEHTSAVRREPIGVVGSIAPWNYPLQMAAWKVLPAMAAGNTIVLKPSELTPLTTLRYAELATEAGVPDGVFNVVTGPGIGVGDKLVEHPDVDMVSFTGSTRVGKVIGATAAGAVKRVHLELGGKAPFIVHDDADLEAAARGAVAGSLINVGQDCTAATRAYVHSSVIDEFVDRVSGIMRNVTFGASTDRSSDLGSLISLDHRDKVHGMVERAREAGATVVCGGELPENTPEGTSFYPPTLITGATQDSEIVQDEVFGPVLVVLPFDTDEEAIRLANDTPFGLAASVWTTNVYRAQQATRELQAGCVWVNDHIPIISEMPHGGYKASGFGKDMSQYSLDEYTNVKHVISDITAEQHKDWHELIFAPVHAG